MGEEKNIHVKFAEGEQVKTLIILEGEAAKPFNNHPVQNKISGDINSIVNYLLHREALLNKDTVVIFFDEVKGIITLKANPSDELALVITAKSESYPDLDKFSINQNKTFTQTDLEQLIKMSKIYFADRDEHSKILTELGNFKAKVQSELEASKDKRSNETKNFSKQVTSGLSADFKLCMPLFKGSENSVFRVEICYDVTDSSVRFWLESVELFELQKDAVKKAFEPQWTDFVSKGFTCINQ